MTTLALKQRKVELRMREGWSAFIFLSLALIMVTWSINEAGYDESLRHLVLVTLGSIAASLFLTKSRLPWFLAHLFSLMYGITWGMFIISFQLPATFSTREKVLELGYRIGSWFQQTVLSGQAGTDPLMFTVVMTILFWFMTYFAMWFSFRAHSMWAALLPSGVTLLVNLYYGPDRISFVLVPYLLFVLLFIVRYNLYAQERSWRRRRVRYDTDIVYTFLRYGATLAVIVIAVAWVLPAAASSESAEVFLSRFGEPWDRLKEEWIRLFSTLQSERVEPSYGGFGATLGLGGPVSLGNVTLMDVQATGGRYWRAAVYDRYDGRSWTLSESESVILEPGEPPGEMPAYEARKPVTQTFTLYMPGTTQVYALGQPEQFSLPVRAEVIPIDEAEEGDPAVESVSIVHSRYKFRNTESYVVISSIALAEEDAMRLAGGSYPAWTERYLELPEALPQRVRDLAAEVTTGYDNAYDKAAALESFLREYEYNEKIEAPPEGVDRVDYFLFEMKEGYCNYYASAMAVMARSVGIPARVAAGYARGDWEDEAKVYRVRQHHAHAWVEVFLPRFGWVEFEPTASEPVIIRPRAAGSSSDRPLDTSGGPPYWEDQIPEDYLNPGGPFDRERFEELLAAERRRERIRTWTRIGGVAAVSIVIVLVAWWMGRRQMDEVRPARAYYERMTRRGDWLGCKMALADTANEYAAKLSSSLKSEEGSGLVSRITTAYVGEQYGNKNPARYQPDFAWRDLRPILTRWGIGQLWRRLWGKA
ncbi:MAG TPA: transglutaminaseTgpA domain-containing protein [Anaerolineae bacterium]|nr:transglutaminaseTgpA domain-containing protein [Anaerolineae bacterium]